MGWIKPLSKIASSSTRNLKDEELVKALMAQAGVQDEKTKPGILDYITSASGIFEWTDDAKKAMKEGSGAGGFLKSYLRDIPRTFWGNL